MTHMLVRRARLQIFDNANLFGGINPTGSLVFTLFGPGDAACAVPIFVSTIPVAGNGSYNSARFTTAQAGIYRWTVSYGGDANNNPVGPTPCSDPVSSVIVDKANVVLTTTASPSATTIHDTATIAGGFNPTGTVTFDLYGPGDTFCGAPRLFTSTVTVNGNGNYPSAPFTPTISGMYKWKATYSGDTNNLGRGPTGCLDPNEAVDVSVIPPTLTLATTASSGVAVGGSIHDTATLAGGTSPTGTITFTLFGPNNATCTGPPIFTAPPVPVVGAGSYDSASFTTTGAGLYRWVAAYSGDANNVGITTTCGDPAESVTVTGPPPLTLTTTASPDVAVGGSIHDTATLAGGTNPTGTITFDLFGPDNATCSGTPIFTSIKTVAGAGAYDSASFIPTATGTYRWTAFYSGDAKNSAVPPTACADPAESVAIVAGPAVFITTTASPGVAVGGAVHDTANVAFGTAPTGTIIFTLFGPDNTTCVGTPIFTSTVSIAGTASYDSASFIPTAPGVYRWVTAYSGDANNPPVTRGCNTPGESVTVTTPSVVSLTTTASPGVAVGQAIQDTATLSGGTAPPGTITFHLFGPDNATCTGTPVFMSTVAVGGPGGYVSGSFLPAAPGTYRWVASYSGDANNAAVPPIACGTPAESVAVTATPPAHPTITTTASPSVLVGDAIHDTAILAGGATPTGTITFRLFDAADATCTTPPVFVSTLAVDRGAAAYDSAMFTPTAPGGFSWTASYSGDAQNARHRCMCRSERARARFGRSHPDHRHPRLGGRGRRRPGPRLGSACQ